MKSLIKKENFKNIMVVGTTTKMVIQVTEVDRASREAKIIEYQELQVRTLVFSKR